MCLGILPVTRSARDGTCYTGTGPRNTRMPRYCAQVRPQRRHAASTIAVSFLPCPWVDRVHNIHITYIPEAAYTPPFSLSLSPLCLPLARHSMLLLLRLPSLLLLLLGGVWLSAAAPNPGFSVSASNQIPLHAASAPPSGEPISQHLFDELEELSRIVDIAYCVGSLNTGVEKPFECLSFCRNFPSFELKQVRATILPGTLTPLQTNTPPRIDLEHRPHPLRLLRLYSPFSPTGRSPHHRRIPWDLLHH